MELVKVNIEELIPYENNPRINDGAVEAVAESIKQCEYVTPIIVDEEMVILAGHTRLKALKKLGYTECEIIVKAGLTEDQKKKYRILDNKTSEFAKWDTELLAAELEDIDFEGFDFGFIDLADIDVDGFFTETEDKPKEPKTMICPHCGEVIEL